MNCRFSLTILFFLLTACAVHDRELPVREINTYRAGKNLFYRVQRRDTIYSIAWQTESDYRKLIKINHLKLPYIVHAGHIIQLTGNPEKTRKYQKKHPPQKQLPKVTHYFRWPTRGKIIQNFSDMNKGIDIKGSQNTPIFAADKGKVVYADDGIHGYGYLVIIKHDENYLTAYGYNSALQVREGQQVKAGQLIARMGTTPSGKTYALHFEVRENGKPLDPKRYLK